MYLTKYKNWILFCFFYDIFFKLFQQIPLILIANNLYCIKILLSSQEIVIIVAEVCF